MALATNELYSDNTNGPRIRIQPHADGVAVCTFDGITDGPLYPQGMPMAQLSTTGLWVPLTQGGANAADAIAGFVWDFEGVQTHDSSEVQGNIMKLGVIHWDDINTAAIIALCGGTMTETVLKAAARLQAVRSLGLIIQGLDLVG